MKKKKIKNVLVRISVLILAILFVIISPSLELFADDMLFFYNAFVGNKSEYQGCVEVWNIDSFESGSKSKLSYLEYCAGVFQKKNKGCYVVIRNLTEGECLNLLSSGVSPDLISCSYGISDKINDFIGSYKDMDVKIDDKFLNVGRDKNGELRAIAWCVGYYWLISTKSKLEKTHNIEMNLNEIALSSSYEYKIGKKVRKSVSLGFGCNDYLMPKNALIAYNRARSIQTENLSQNEIKYNSQYAAYSSFIANNVTILLGTQRDVYRMSSREESGKVSDVIYLPLTNWTDLVQYIFPIKASEGLKKEYAEKFVCCMVEESNQKQLKTIGMFPVIAVKDVLYDGVMRDIILENFSDLELKSLF